MPRRRRFPALAATTAATAALLALAGPLPAQRSLAIERFDAEVLVRQDGSLGVTERIQVRFRGEWNGIYRSIPVEYTTPQGLNHSLWLTLEEVTDDSGRVLETEASRERHYRKIKIWVPDARDATRTVVLRYRVRNALKFFEEHDELYWNVTGDEWEVPIRSATARVYLPPGATGLRARAFTGGYGSSEQAARVDVGGSDVAFRTTRSLEFREGLTVAVAWDPGLVRRPTALSRARHLILSNWTLLLPVLLLAGMGRLWYARGRDPRLRPISVQYEPPDALTPAELGTLVDNRPDLRDITATLVDLAVRGFVTMEETGEDVLFGLAGKRDYLIQLVRQPELEEVRPHERVLLSSLFDGFTRDFVRLSDLDNSFYKHLPAIRDRIYDRLVVRRYYAHRPDRVRATYMGLGAMAVGFAGFAAGWINARVLGIGIGSSVAATALSVLIVLGFGYFMPARTQKGARALEGVLGFEEFLRRVEGDRIERVVKTPELFERLLPFAMALGVEKGWARAFEGIYRTPPQWYRGGDVSSFRTTSFVGSLGRMSERAGSAMSSSPRSSGGSGFSGGGSSGGGFGGGGGGGF